MTKKRGRDSTSDVLYAELQSTVEKVLCDMDWGEPRDENGQPWNYTEQDIEGITQRLIPGGLGELQVYAFQLKKPDATTKLSVLLMDDFFSYWVKGHAIKLAEKLIDGISHFYKKKNESSSDTATGPDEQELSRLFDWYQLVSMQQESTIGKEQTKYCWDKLRGLTKKKLREDPELFNLLAALRDQYLNGFTGKGDRQQQKL